MAGRYTHLEAPDNPWIIRVRDNREGKPINQFYDHSLLEGRQLNAIKCWTKNCFRDSENTSTITFLGFVGSFVMHNTLHL